MSMEVEIISRETIKPSSPTPPHLRNYKFSLLDQLIPPIYTPTVLFYSSGACANPTDLISQRIQLLKQSLSKALTHFYPLAGKRKDNLSIDCNDEGAYYAEARVKCTLSDFLNRPQVSMIHRLLPSEVSCNESNKGFHVAMIQVNIFDCSGIAIGVFLSHLVVDGTARSNFFKSWAATACGFERPCPSYIAPSIFLQNDSFPKELNFMALINPFLKTGKSVTRRFMFDSSAMAMLKAKATSSCGQSPTRAQAVTALIWKRFMATCAAKYCAQKPCFMFHTVNLRRRASPPFPESCMGNFLLLAVAKCEAEADIELHQLAGAVKEAVSKIDGNLVKQLEGDEGFIKFCDSLKGLRQELDHKEADLLGFTSWLNFGLYEVDFGWGKPVWATCAGSRDSASDYFNSVVLMEAKSGDGVEAWVFLGEQDMAIFENDTELLNFSSVDPSPIP
ncbi:stemmadenine O-acetyltransferase-like [Actinidia eriantha]|uniref:stemmadenine O-acetyltransferase-like n=1 Tax=Actinidia eriantha TaxID=165200 RepID=UPI002587C231|nr:stemmadenine O-acetyltransferase-like [Actinidia eriantha]